MVSGRWVVNGEWRMVSGGYIGYTWDMHGMYMVCTRIGYIQSGTCPDANS
jgi:hypothetical protein